MGNKKGSGQYRGPSDSYTLTATATNSEGSASDAFTLSWGCNRPPVIASIVVDEDFHYTDETYHVSVNTSDPDGDSLSVTWSVNGGSINDIHANPMNWTTPSGRRRYDITVEVDDGNGGTATLTESVEVLPALPPPVAAMDVPYVASESGYIVKNQEAKGSSVTGAFIGDSSTNRFCRGYMSYDISSLSGVTVTDATITFPVGDTYGTPSFGIVWLGIVEWGAEPLVISDYNLSGTALQSFSGPSFTCSNQTLKNELQDAIDDGKSRFQVRIHFSIDTSDGDSSWTGWLYDKDDIILNVVYTMP